MSGEITQVKITKGLLTKGKEKAAGSLLRWDDTERKGICGIYSS
jgi:hypothetical protein